MAVISPAMMDEIEKRKEDIRRLWKYKKIDHIPVMLQVRDNPWGYTTQDHFMDGDKQFDLEYEQVKLSLELMPDDYIPTMRPDVGCIVIESALGAEVVYGDDPEQTNTIKGPILSSIDEVYDLKKPDITKDGLVPDGIGRIKKFVERTDGQVYVSCLDMGGGMNVAFTLLGGVNALTAMYEAPEALQYLSNFITEVFMEIAEASIEAAGGIEHVTCSDFPFIWQPEGHKGHVSDDISAQYSPEFFNIFSKPYNNKVYQKWGGGMMHNCGPNPCVSEYLAHDPPIHAVDLAWDWSKNDLQAFKEHFRQKGVIYFYFETGTWQENLADYRHVMETLAPDVAAVPCVWLTPEHDVADIYWKFREVSDEYAKRMDWLEE